MADRYSLPPNVESKDPVPKRRAGEATHLPDDKCSWLGKWSDGGWSIRIEPKLTREEWDRYFPHADEGWEPKTQRYEPLLTMEVLNRVYPTHRLSVVWPKCTYRESVGRAGDEGRFYYVNCGAVGKHTETHLRDVYDNRVALARCDAHQGKL